MGLCPQCGSPRAARSSERIGEADWRRQVRETVQRRKELRRQQQEQRESVARQLTIFGEVGESDPERDRVRQRRAEIRARVQQRVEKLSPQRHRIRALADAGEVSIRVGEGRLGAAAVATAPEVSDVSEAPDMPDRVDRPNRKVPPSGTHASYQSYEDAESIPDSMDAVQELDELEGAEEAAPRPRRSARAHRSPSRVGSDTIEHFELASPGERMLAGLIDFGFLTFLFLGLAYLTTNLAHQPLQALPRPALAALGCVGFLLGLGYFLFFWSLSGQTLGKLLTSSRVVDPLGQPLGFSRALVRSLGIALSLLPLGAGFVGLWSDIGRRSWHDRLASTKVVRV